MKMTIKPLACFEAVNDTDHEPGDIGVRRDRGVTRAIGDDSIRRCLDEGPPLRAYL